MIQNGIPDVPWTALSEKSRTLQEWERAGVLSAFLAGAAASMWRGDNMDREHRNMMTFALALYGVDFSEFTSRGEPLVHSDKPMPTRHPLENGDY